MDKRELAHYIKAEALRLGFDVCGIAKAEPVSEETAAYCNQWIGEGKHGTMHYLERNCESPRHANVREEIPKISKSSR